jgi:hypothetical protein
LSDASIIVNDHRAAVVTDDASLIEMGMPLRVAGEEAVIADIQSDEYGRKVGIAEISLPDGTYEGVVVTDQTHPIAFLFNAGDN